MSAEIFIHTFHFPRVLPAFVGSVFQGDESSHEGVLWSAAAAWFFRCPSLICWNVWMQNGRYLDVGSKVAKIN